MVSRRSSAPGDGSARAAADASWSRVALISGWVAGVGLAAQTALFLLDAAEVLADHPELHRTGAGAEVDRAQYYADFFNRQHSVLWDIVVRDTVGPVAFLALALWALAVVFRLRPVGPTGPMTILFFTVGSILHIVQDLIYLSLERFWRFDDWSADPPGPMNAFGAATDAVDLSTTHLEASSYLVLAAGTWCLARLVLRDDRIPRWLGVAASIESASLVLLGIGIALQQDLLFQIGGGFAGIVLGPLVAIGLGHALTRAEIRTA
jgi:hypothetical protein